VKTTWPRLAFATPAEFERLQNALLRKQLMEEVAPFSRFYAARWQDLDLRSFRGSDDLAQLGLTKAHDLRGTADPAKRALVELRPTPAALRSAWPFRRKLALVLGGRAGREVLRKSYAPCATFPAGDDIVVSATAHDLNTLAESCARGLEIAGVDWQRARIVDALPPSASWLASLGLLTSWSRGPLVINVTGDDFEHALRERGNVWIAEADWIARAAAWAREQGKSLDELETVVCITTDGALDRDALRTALSEAGSSAALVSAFAQFATRQLAFECPTADGSPSGWHLLPDTVLAEILDTNGAAQLASADPGELVLTPLSGHGTALVRFQTDLRLEAGITWERCPHCRRTLPRLVGPLTCIA